MSNNPGPAAYVPKVGDRVRIKSSRYATGAGSYVGREATVEHVGFGGEYDSVRVVVRDDGEAICYYRPSDLEPASAPPPTPDARVVALEAELAAVRDERETLKAALAGQRELVHEMRVRAQAAELTVRELRVQLERAERDRDSWRSEAMRLKAAPPTPAPATTLDALRAAFVDALARNESSEFDACLSWNAREAKNQLKAAIAARAKGGVA